MTWTERINRAVLRSSLLWGGVASAAVFMALPYCEPWINPFLLRCLTGRWEAYACVAMFLIGMASLSIKAVDLVIQTMFMQREIFSTIGPGDNPVASARALRKQLDAMPAISQQTPLVRRLREALDSVARKANETLDEQLHYLADQDITRMTLSYGLTRFMSWAIPAVGSFATVLGIAQAVTGLSAETSAETLTNVTQGLAQAFDTMALALALSTVLVFLKFVCEQHESKLLSAVDERVKQEIDNRLASAILPRNTQFDQLRKLTESVVEATEKLAQRQTGLWQDSLEQTHQRWDAQSAAMGDQLESIVSRAVAKAVTGQPLGMAAPPSEGQLSSMTQVQQALQQIAEFFTRQNAEQIQESEVFQQLSEMIRETSAAVPTKSGPHFAKSNSPKDSLAGLWNSLSD